MIVLRDPSLPNRQQHSLIPSKQLRDAVRFSVALVKFRQEFVRRRLGRGKKPLSKEDLKCLKDMAPFERRLHALFKVTRIELHKIAAAIVDASSLSFRHAVSLQLEEAPQGEGAPSKHSKAQSTFASLYGPIEDDNPIVTDAPIWVASEWKNGKIETTTGQPSQQGVCVDSKLYSLCNDIRTLEARLAEKRAELAKLVHVTPDNTEALEAVMGIVGSREMGAVDEVADPVEDAIPQPKTVVESAPAPAPAPVESLIEKPNQEVVPVIEAAVYVLVKQKRALRAIEIADTLKALGYQYRGKEPLGQTIKASLLHAIQTGAKSLTHNKNGRFTARV